MKVTITTDGLGREQNPHLPITDGSGKVNHKFFDFDEAHPALPVISETGEAVTDPGSYQATKEWEITPTDGSKPFVAHQDTHDFFNNDFSSIKESNLFSSIKEVYRILHQPKEAVKEETMSLKEDVIKFMTGLNWSADIREFYLLGALYGQSYEINKYQSTHIEKSKVVELVEKYAKWRNIDLDILIENINETWQ